MTHDPAKQGMGPLEKYKHIQHILNQHQITKLPAEVMSVMYGVSNPLTVHFAIQ